ncbi:MAG: hypothetical protein BRD44_01200 [Bacteroidetes bacterium QS_7_67_15]|nr:MAG: hypothetical protein BRD44_01200 [Bacteroidetes bacterium QS_7_67_15]
MLTPVDYVVIVAYLVGIATLGIWAGGSQDSTDDYFLGGRDMPWGAVCLSVVATETSTLTVISVPTVAYGGALTFVQLALGYLVGRTLVALYFLPRYYRGSLSTAYAFLGERFGRSMQASASVTFLFTRLLADGVRLFATAIPLKLIADSVGLETTYFQIIALIGVVTIIYTLIGGIRAVVWMDTVQMLLYLFGAVFTIVLLLGEGAPDWWQQTAEAGKMQFFNPQLGAGLSAWLTDPYALVTAVAGGAVFSMASHGTDQLVVQRLLACRNLRDSQKALVGSALLVGVQFFLFSVIGLLLWNFYDGQTIQQLGYAAPDELFPRFIVSGLPVGMSGLLLAGIVAAAMSTLSSSLNGTDDPGLSPAGGQRATRKRFPAGGRHRRPPEAVTERVGPVAGARGLSLARGHAGVGDRLHRVRQSVQQHRQPGRRTGPFDRVVHLRRDAGGFPAGPRQRARPPARRHYRLFRDHCGDDVGHLRRVARAAGVGLPARGGRGARAGAGRRRRGGVQPDRLPVVRADGGRALRRAWIRARAAAQTKP